jgi:hypothetical protein
MQLSPWATVPVFPMPGAAGWAHSDIAFLADGSLLTAHPDGGALVVSAADGQTRSIPAPIHEAHGLHVLDESVWVADTGFKMRPDTTGSYAWTGPWSGQVLKLGLDGSVITELPTPPRDSDRPYLPTAVTPDGEGQVWVADGYGASQLHVYGSGQQVRTVTGTESPAGHFDCPHALLVDRRRAEPEMYIADRARHRLVVLGLDGTYHREVTGVLHLPSALATCNELLLVAELNGRVTVLDLDDRVVSRSGIDPEAPQRDGWPNSLAPDGELQRPVTEEGVLNSPHGLAVDATGRVVLAEWLIGGRVSEATLT